MPKAPKTRPKKHKPDLPPSFPPRPPAPKFTATKETILEILLAKVEDSRSFDWHGLSEKLHLPAADTPAGKFKGKGNPRRGGKEADGCARLCGTDLCEIFYQSILPALRQGLMPWEKDGTVDSSEGSTPPSLTPGSSTVSSTRPTRPRIATEGRKDKAQAVGGEKGQGLDDGDSEGGLGEETEKAEAEEAEGAEEAEAEEAEAEEADESYSVDK